MPFLLFGSYSAHRCWDDWTNFYFPLKRQVSAFDAQNPERIKKCERARTRHNLSIYVFNAFDSVAFWWSIQRNQCEYRGRITGCSLLSICFTFICCSLIESKSIGCQGSEHFHRLCMICVCVSFLFTLRMIGADSAQRMGIRK